MILFVLATICVLILLFLIIFYIIMSYSKWERMNNTINKVKKKKPIKSATPPPSSPPVASTAAFNNMILALATSMANGRDASCVMTKALPQIKTELMVFHKIDVDNANLADANVKSLVDSVIQKHISNVIAEDDCKTNAKAASSPWLSAPLCTKAFEAGGHGNYMDSNGLWWGWDEPKQERCAFRPNPKCVPEGLPQCVNPPARAPASAEGFESVSQPSYSPSPSLAHTSASPAPSFEPSPSDNSTDILVSPKCLGNNSMLTSKNGRYNMIMQTDGKVVIIDTKTGTTVWSSMDSDTTREVGPQFGPYKLCMQDDGNLVAYATNRSSYNDGTQGNAYADPAWVWATDTSAMGIKPFTLSISDEGHGTISDSRGVQVWSTYGWLRTCSKAAEQYLIDYPTTAGDPWQNFLSMLKSAPDMNRVWKGPPCRDCLDTSFSAASTYLKFYPDVRDSGMSPAEHYQNVGVNLKRVWTGMTSCLETTPPSGPPNDPNGPVYPPPGLPNDPTQPPYDPSQPPYDPSAPSDPIGPPYNLPPYDPSAPPCNPNGPMYPPTMPSGPSYPLPPYNPNAPTCNPNGPPGGILYHPNGPQNPGEPYDPSQLPSGPLYPGQPYNPSGPTCTPYDTTQLPSGPLYPGQPNPTQPSGGILYHPNGPLNPGEPYDPTQLTSGPLNPGQPYNPSGPTCTPYDTTQPPSGPLYPGQPDPTQPPGGILYHPNGPLNPGEPYDPSAPPINPNGPPCDPTQPNWPSYDLFTNPAPTAAPYPTPNVSIFMINPNGSCANENAIQKGDVELPQLSTTKASSSDIEKCQSQSQQSLWLPYMLSPGCINSSSRLVSQNKKYVAGIWPNGLLGIASMRSMSLGPDIWTHRSDDTTGVFGDDGGPPYRLCLLDNGSLAFIDGDNSILWNTYAVMRGAPPFKLMLGNDAALKVWDNDGILVWESHLA